MPFIGNLSSYKPNSLNSSFELGITRRTDDKKSNNLDKQNTDLDEKFHMLKPASSTETKSFSTTSSLTKASDLLF